MSLERNSLLVGSASLVAAAFSYLFNPLFLAPRLGPEGIAVIGVFLYLNFFLSFPQQPIGLTLTRYAAEYDAENAPAKISALLKRGLKKLTLYGIVLMAIIVMLSPGLQSYLKLDSQLPIFGGALLALMGLYLSLAQGALQGLQRFRAYAVLSIYDPAFRLIVGITCVLLGWGITGVMLGYLAGYLSPFIISLWFLRRYLALPQDRTINRVQIYSYSLPIWIFAFYFAFASSVDGLIAKHYFSENIAGLFIAASTLGKMTFVVLLPVSGVAFAMMSEAVSRKQDPGPLLKKTCAYVVLVSLTAVLIVTSVPHLILKFTYGPAFYEATLLLPYYTLMALPVGLTLMYSSFCLAKKRRAFIFGLLLGGIIRFSLMHLFHAEPQQLVWASLTGAFAEGLLCVAFDRKCFLHGFFQGGL